MHSHKASKRQNIRYNKVTYHEAIPVFVLLYDQIGITSETETMQFVLRKARR